MDREVCSKKRKSYRKKSNQLIRNKQKDRCIENKDKEIYIYKDKEISIMRHTGREKEIDEDYVVHNIIIYST